jgi:methylenetetrahydrofolate dehydrogenase (NADP+)/methenyltetrahydrofolate cyclohydrolase
MSATIIDGTAMADRLRARIAEKAAELIKSHGVTPGLAVVLVGEDPASKVYVSSKGKATLAAGMASFEHKLPADVPEAELLALVAKLNADPTVHGILVQLPLPKGFDEAKVISTIDPAKDVDGLHPINSGALVAGTEGFIPCTPLGSLILTRSVHASLTGLNAVVIGRSRLVGKPMSLLLLNENATVTMAHSKTRDLPALCRTADILVAAVGRPEMVKADWIKPGATVIDVGINRLPHLTDPAKTRLVGDVAFAEAKEVAGAITPVPGGVGKMTIACLLANTIYAVHRKLGLPAPNWFDL